jgi:hypothetical protein
LWARVRAEQVVPQRAPDHENALSRQRKLSRYAANAVGPKKLAVL